MVMIVLQGKWEGDGEEEMYDWERVFSDMGTIAGKLRVMGNKKWFLLDIYWYGDKYFYNLL